MTTKSLDEKLKKLNKQHPQLKRENVNNEEPQRKMKKEDKEGPPTVNGRRLTMRSPDGKDRKVYNE